MTKFLTIIIMAVFLTPINGVVEKYFFNDWEFLIYLFLMIVIDTILGFLKHYKRGTVSSKAWGKIITKLISYGSLLIVGHILAGFTVQGDCITSFNWIRTFVYTSLMVKEGISIIENIGAINESFVPKWLLKKLKEFDEQGKFLS